MYLFLFQKWLYFGDDLEWIEISNYVLRYTSHFIARHNGTYTASLAYTGLNKLKSRRWPQCWHGLLLCPVDGTNRFKPQPSVTLITWCGHSPSSAPSISSSPFNSCRPSPQALCALSAMFTLRQLQSATPQSILVTFKGNNSHVSKP